VNFVYCLIYYYLLWVLNNYLFQFVQTEMVNTTGVIEKVLV